MDADDPSGLKKKKAKAAADSKKPKKAGGVRGSGALACALSDACFPPGARGL